MPKPKIPTSLMIGHVTHESVRVWCREPSGKQGIGKLLLYDTSGAELRSSEVIFDVRRGGTAIVDFGDLPDANTAYTLTLELESEDIVTGAFKTNPPPEVFQSFSFMFASCFLNRNYLVRRKDRVYPSLHRISKEIDASFMIFCGDQIYIDTINATTPKNPRYEMYEQKYLDNWTLPGAAEFFGHTPSYMILDDHEIGNDFDNSRVALKKNKEIGLQAYQDFQHSHNPDTDDGDYFYQFQYGTIQFFVMDTRTERDRSKGFIISDKQEKAVSEWLTRHKDSMKVVISPVPFLIQPKSKFEKWCDPVFERQYRSMLNRLIDSKDPKVIFLCGDYHSAIHSKATFHSGAEITQEWHEFMGGPLNQVLVNPPSFFEKKSKIPISANADESLDYERLQIESKFTNVGAIHIDKEEDDYVIQATWYRAQHESKVVELGKSEIVRVKG